MIRQLKIWTIKCIIRLYAFALDYDIVPTDERKQYMYVRGWWMNELRELKDG